MAPYYDMEDLNALVKEMTGEDAEDLFGPDASNILADINQE